MSKKKKKKKRNRSITHKNVAFTDGACVGNPGKMGIGGVIKLEGHEKITFSETPGYGTNNEAEYLAVIKALELLAEIDSLPKTITLCSDSQLIINQIKGLYNINYPHLAVLHGKISKLTEQIPCKFIFTWIPREQNKTADALASKAVGMPQTVIQNDNIISWQGTKDYTSPADMLNELPLVKPDCKKALSRLLILGSNAKFTDFINLKTGGIDGYSRAKTEKLIEYATIRFGKEAVEWLENATSNFNTNYGRTALRWTARGLPPDIALKKVSVDMEIRANMKKRR